MLAADEVWCQLFSEPAAGSDLAGIQTRAQPPGRRHVAAVGPEGVDDERPARGVRAAARAHRRRRAQAQGPDDVRRADGRRRRDDPPAAPDLRRGALQRGVPRRRRARRRARRSGPVDGGWGVAHDHADVRAGGDRARRRGLRLARRPLRGTRCWRTRRRTRDPEVRHRFGEIATEFLALRFTGYRMLTALQRGQIPGPEGALAKVTTIRGGDRGGRAALSTCSARRRWPTTTGASSSPTCRGSSPPAGPRRSCATWSASACSACRPSRGWTRASRSPSCARSERSEARGGAS